MLVATLAATACRPTETSQTIQTSEVPTVNPLMRADTPAPGTDGETPGVPSEPAAESIETSGSNLFRVVVDTTREVHAISPYIYGLSGGTEEETTILRTTLTSWGGNPSTRYNWELGNAWNSASDWFYRNGNYDYTGESASDDAAAYADENGIAMRLAVPTLGWVAKNDDNDTCSFPLADGSCGTADNANCANPGQIADPTLANVQSDPDFIRRWLQHLFIEKGFDIEFIAMDNEPELWGYTHYDVHPDCTTYAEVLDKFLTYAEVVKEVAPEAEITAPNTCCWYYYWNSAAGQVDMDQYDDEPFIPWFLSQVRQHDEASGGRTLDVLDIHFYPEAVYNNEIDQETAELRLRSTRLLWDEAYEEETWIAEPIALIPTMKAIIDRYYPGTKLALSEWNWGADNTMNGALAIADVLGTFGREDLYFAAYWRNPVLGSAGFHAFQLYTNYDGEGGRFGDTSVWSETTDYDTVSSYAALDSESGSLHLMLVNKYLDGPLEIQVELGDFETQPQATYYRIDQGSSSEIGTGTADISADGSFIITLPPYSITHLVIDKT
jgi:hypothetical protein